MLDALDTDPRCEKCGGQSLTSYGDPSMFVGQRLSQQCTHGMQALLDILQADSADAYADAIVCREREDDDRCRSRVDLESFFRLKRLSEDFSVVDLLFQQGLSKDDVWSILDSLSGFIFRDGKDQDFDELRRWHIEEYEAGWAKVRSGQSGAIYDCAYPCPKCGQRSLRL
ncbi:MAG: hypothetical protein IPH43_06395 [Xanthomonadales bacterium]|nr:hypothetical protein [Xanthomonadales bacterium]